MKEENKRFIGQLISLNEALSSKSKKQLLSALQSIDDYFIAYAPDLWDVSVQGVLEDLFSNWNNRNPLIWNLINDKRIQLRKDEESIVKNLIEQYNLCTSLRGKMRYKPSEPLVKNNNINEKNIEERVNEAFELTKHNYQWFVRYYCSQKGEKKGPSVNIKLLKPLSDKREFNKEDVTMLFDACLDFSERQIMVVLYYLNKEKLINLLNLYSDGYTVSTAFKVLGKSIGRKFSNINYWNNQINNSRADYFNPASISQLPYRLQELALVKQIFKVLNHKAIISEIEDKIRIIEDRI